MSIRPALIALLASALCLTGPIPATASRSDDLRGPENGEIAFGRFDPALDGLSLWVAESDGSRQRRLTEDQANFSDWAPDGNRIALTSSTTPVCTSRPSILMGSTGQQLRQQRECRKAPNGLPRVDRLLITDFRSRLMKRISPYPSGSWVQTDLNLDSSQTVPWMSSRCSLPMGPESHSVASSGTALTGNSKQST